MKEEMLGKEMSSCETVIMKAIWDSKEDISTPDLIELLREKYGKDYARTTVVTFIQRLINKGFVSTYRKGRVAYIHAEREEADYKANLMDKQTDFWFEGSESNLVASLCKRRKVSSQEIEKIREILDGMDD